MTGQAGERVAPGASASLLGTGQGGLRVNGLEGVLGTPIIRFVERHVRSLLVWDILVFFHRNPDTVLDTAGIASLLGRRVEEVEPEIDLLCADRILDRQDGSIRYRPDSETHQAIASFVDACQDRGRRLALIALVLHRIGPQAKQPDG